MWRRHVDLLKELSSADTVPTVSTPHSAVGAEVVLPASHRLPMISGSVPETVEVTTLVDVRSSEAPISGAAAVPTATPVRVPSTAPTQSYPSRNRNPADYFRLVSEIQF